MMGGEKQKFLTVAPFECAWCKELRFREAGRGCVAFEAFAQNDVTLVFREQVGSQHYHYKMDNSPNYTVIFGSHRNRRLKIEVNGKAVADVAGIGLCCSSAFQSYWISIFDGLISIGKGRHPFQNLVFQWLDSEPNCNVQYVGLSSWDKHVGYRNINVLPLTQHQTTPWSHIDYKEYEGENDEEEGVEDSIEDYGKWGIMNFLESWYLSDVKFLVGTERKAVPAHKVILAASGDFSFGSSDDNIIHLPSTTYAVLHAFLEYIYLGQTQGKYKATILHKYEDPSTQPRIDVEAWSNAGGGPTKGRVLGRSTRDRASSILGTAACSSSSRCSTRTSSEQGQSSRSAPVQYEQLREAMRAELVEHLTTTATVTQQVTATITQQVTMKMREERLAERREDRKTMKEMMLSFASHVGIPPHRVSSFEPFDDDDDDDDDASTCIGDDRAPSSH